MLLGLINAVAIKNAGYLALLNEDTPAMQCAYDPFEIFAAPDWESLARYAMNYELCGCGRH